MVIVKNILNIGLTNSKKPGTAGFGNSPSPYQNKEEHEPHISFAFKFTRKQRS